MEPLIIQKESFIIAGTKGDGNKTHELWNKFAEKDHAMPLSNKINDDGYEIRIYYENGKCDCFVGVAVTDSQVPDMYELYHLQGGLYVSFDIYPSKGWESSNQEMNAWLHDNSDKFTQLRDENSRAFIAIEYYGSRYHGYNNPESVVEMWIPLKPTVMPH